ncbi:MAG: alanine racemase [Zetaproteobacteria bacterium]|nr:alanine racemase [Zetaproteobacteria bacterium]
MGNTLSWLEISRQNYVKNLDAIQKELAPCKLAPVIKANAYGHGLEQIIQILMSNTSVDTVCVNYIAEAERVRELGFVANILVIGPYHLGLLQRAVDASVEVVLGSEAALLDWLQLEHKPCVHLKLERGMARQGFREEDLLAKFLEPLQKNRSYIKGLSTHLPSPEVYEEARLTQEQWRSFQLGCTRLKQCLGLHERVIEHGLSSRPALRVAADRGHLARIGLLSYGLWPGAGLQGDHPTLKQHLRPVLSWKAQVICVRQLQPGDSVGYGSTYTATQKTQIAVLPVGYYEGYSRLAVSHADAHVLIQGVRCALMGRGCMNMIYVDVSGLTVQQGEEAVLVGKSGALEVTWEQLATWQQTISYEALTRLCPRLTRRIV